MPLSQQDEPRTTTPRFVGWLAALTLLGAAPYLVGVLVPYYVNGLHRFPLAEVAGGAHDPKDLWPGFGLAGGLTQMAGFLSLLLTPATLLLSAFVSGGVLLFDVFSRIDRPSPRVVRTLLGVLVVSIAGLVHFASPMGSALASWRLD